MSSENSSDSKHRQFIWKALAISPVAGYTLVVGGLLILHLVVSAILPPLFPGLTATTLNIMEAIIVSTLTAPLFWLLVVTPLEQSAVSEYVRSQAVLGHIGEGVVTFSEDGVIESSNTATERLFGYSGRLHGTMISSLFSENAAALFGAISEKKGPVTAPVEVIGMRRDGTSFPVELTISRMRQDDRNIGIAVIRSLTEKKKAEERLSYLTSYDSLTGLPNRSLVQDRLAQSLAHSERTGEKGCLIFLDLNNIKTVNETIGHGAGDELLQAAAEILSGWVREGDTVGRMSGNQFALILHNIVGVAAAREACGEILRLLGEQFTVAGRGVYLNVSMGVVLFPSDGNAVDPLLRKAEAALQHANRTGKNDFQFYSSEMNDRVSEKLALETSLRRAVENHELVLHYQPRLDLETGKIVAVEALARWVDPVLGMVPPQKFIPLAEETGLIIGVGEWVLREACRQLAAWKREGIGDIKMSVNVSPMQLRQPDFSKTVQDILQENGIDPGVIELEVTETSAMENTEESIKGFQRLRDMGVGLAIDDFGTGYSSLSYLTRLPVDILKIDRSFVREIPACSDGAAIARTIISMAHSLGLKVVAEGVESDDQMVFLRSHSCQEMQGFLFSTAVSPERMADMMRNHNAEEHERASGE